MIRSKGGGDMVFDPRVVVAVVAAGIIAFAAFLVLFAYSGDFRTGRDGRAHPLSVSAIGFSGVVKLIELQGGSPDMIRNPINRDTEELVVATVEDRTDAKLISELLDARSELPTLVVLPKWLAGPLPNRQSWVQAAGLLPETMIAEPLRKLATVKRVRVRGHGDAIGRDLLEGQRVPLPVALQYVVGKDLKPLLVGPGGSMIVAQVGDRPLYILADPDLLNNKGMKNPATAKAALAMLDSLSSPGATHIGFDLGLNGFGRKNGALKLAFEPPFLALTLALFVAALLAGLHGAFRFGPAAAEAPALALGTAALVENSAGLLRLARREPAVGGAYAELIREAAAYDSGAGGTLQGEALGRYLDRLSPEGETLSSLAARAEAASDRHALLAAARALFSWKKDLIK
jgi:hypothetical protein